jgi:hypothetical protein
MPNIYDDPDLQPDTDYPDQIKLERVGDKVRGRVLSAEKITTRFGPTPKYMLRTQQGDQSLLAGAKNLWGQLLELKPEVGDVLTIELIELRTVSQGTAKIFDVACERGDRPAVPPPVPEGQGFRGPSEPSGGSRPDPGRAASRAAVDDDPDLFDQ